MYVSYQNTLINLKNVNMVNCTYEKDNLCLSFTFFQGEIPEVIFSFDTVFELDDAYEQILEALSEKKHVMTIRKRENPNEEKA